MDRIFLLHAKNIEEIFSVLSDQEVETLISIIDYNEQKGRRNHVKEIGV